LELTLSLSLGAYNPLMGASVGGGAGATAPPTVADASATARDSGLDTAVQDFLDYAKKTPAERMRDAILKSMGLTEEDLKSMSPEKRKAVEETIRQKIKQAAEEAAKKGKTGLVADVTA
jgi:hypothetical protein